MNKNVLSYLLWFCFYCVALICVHCGTIGASSDGVKIVQTCVAVGCMLYLGTGAVGAWRD